jgi:hypothetical protein
MEPLASWPVHTGLLNVWSLTPDRVERAVARLPARRDRPRQFIGPQPDWWIEQDIARLQNLLGRIRARGYVPERVGGAHVTGYFLVRGQDARFVCRHGNHRLAVLSFLGHEEIEVMVAPHVTPIVNYDDLEWWSAERGGLYPTPVAEELFRKMFTETGHDKARNLAIIGTD